MDKKNKKVREGMEKAKNDKSNGGRPHATHKNTDKHRHTHTLTHTHAHMQTHTHKLPQTPHLKYSPLGDISAVDAEDVVHPPSVRLGDPRLRLSA